MNRRDQFGQHRPTPTRLLLRWLEDPRADRGLWLLRGSSWAFQSYAELAERVYGAANYLARAGVRRGDVVALATSDCVDFLSHLVGTLYVGGTPLPLPPEPALDRYYETRLRATLESARPRFIVSSDEAGERVAAASGCGGGEASVLGVERARATNYEAAELAEVALLQYTSGSTGLPRGVSITWGNLDSNVSMIHDWLDLSRVSGVSWLPLHHDMGLIGLLAMVCAQADVWQMLPGQFLLDPVRWLRCVSTVENVVTAAPTFGYAYVARRVSPANVRTLNFSGWCRAVVGAERITPTALVSFIELAADRGFRPSSFCPAYGMAEATLAVTGHQRDSVPAMVQIGWERMDIGMPLEIRASMAITDSHRADSAGFLVSSGAPLPDATVSIVDDEGIPLPDCTLGEIAVEGPSVAAGYHSKDPVGATRFEGRRVLTGDGGFMFEGELFVIGRIGDSVKVAGRHIYAESLELKIAEALNLPVHQCIVVPSPGAASEAVAAIVQRPRGNWTDKVVAALRPELGPSVQIRMYTAESASILRTTSGKPRRREIWRRLVSDQAAAEALSTPAPRHPRR